MKRNIVISNTDTCKDVQGGECDSKNKLKTTITGNGKKYEAVHLITKEECKLENAEGTLQPTDTKKLELWEVEYILIVFFIKYYFIKYYFMKYYFISLNVSETHISSCCMLIS